ncbi:telomere repeat-binding protein 2 [Sesamum indicum]|uniref:Telomere repeat-binding protein 2 n=1 Tax=Sesamum indicum TaxID=4182 RepID=A0A6I9TU65_SESIN|nr:telomere repeat-binding protein 2 [Sesamum indicum]XP_011089488.1 telomere repeat-binding protein 2 [Sesamum indicum]
MALQKRLDYGFNGYQVPPTPRAARSVRRRCVFKRKADDQQMCAFDLLATVAGKLLLDGESPASAHASCRKEQPAALEDSVGKEEKDENKPLEEKSCDQNCYERNFLFTELVSEAPKPNFRPDELVCTQNDVISRPASGITTSDCSEKVGPAEQLVNDDCKLRLGIFTPSVDVESSGFRVPANCGSEDESRKPIKMDSASTRNFSISNKASLCSSGHSEAWDRKPSVLVSPVDSLKFPFCRDNTPCGSFPGNQDNVKLVNRDDDENSSECNEPGTRNKAFKPQPRVGDRRFRKLLASKHCKITPNVKDDERYNADTERCDYLNRKNNIKRQRSMRDYPFKKRKLYDCSSVSNSEEGVSSDGICTVPANGTNGGGLGPGPTLPGAIPNPTPAAGGNASFHTRNSQVKLKIKSFRVPELYIEIPENATVGSLKRTVLEAVNAVLGGGLRVGVLLQGKKIRDDNKTLLQTGISQDNKMDTLGFTLEPSPTPAPIRLYPEDRRGQLLCDSPQPLARYPPTPSITQNGGQQRNLDTPPDLPGTSFNNFIESDHDSAPSPPGMSLQRTTSESKALVPVPSTKQDALAVVPLRKSKRSESAQRRIRRPFTVAEVEALVQAVEKLGTGRWRDVKLRAFDSAKHRTYVDLKDKWKTLVHTARISPQQRRGEPVPQELLDRVLTAHAYWSQQQAKQQLKSQPDTSLLL